MTPLQTMRPRTRALLPAKAWLRALELTAPIARNRDRVLSTVIEELAAQLGDAPALLSDRECLTYRSYLERANQYARWALDQGLWQRRSRLPVDGESARIHRHMAWHHQCWRCGCAAEHQSGRPSLAHCINVVSPKHLIVAAEFAEQFASTLPHLSVAAHDLDSRRRTGTARFGSAH